MAARPNVLGFGMAIWVLYGRQTQVVLVSPWLPDPCLTQSSCVGHGCWTQVAWVGHGRQTKTLGSSMTVKPLLDLRCLGFHGFHARPKSFRSGMTARPKALGSYMAVRPLPDSMRLGPAWLPDPRCLGLAWPPLWSVMQPYYSIVLPIFN